jgi:hydroxymethylbilane synthase
MADAPVLLATRGSALALAQANAVLESCRRNFPTLAFQLKIIKTSGDKLQSASLSRLDSSLPRGLFTKELEDALLRRGADLAVHSLKDLPTDLPAGLKLGAVAGARADVRDVLIYRQSKFPKPRMKPADFPAVVTVATGSTRRKAQLLALRPDFNFVEIRGNVPTRLQKLATQTGFDATILAAAGLDRLQFRINAAGTLEGDGVPEGLLATVLETGEMLPCVGQGAIGLEIRQDDDRMAQICGQLNDYHTLQCVVAERAFLQGMGGGCQTPIGACATVIEGQIHLQVVSFLGGKVQRAEALGKLEEPQELGERVAAQLSGPL